MGPVRLVADRLSYDIVRRSVVAHGAALYAPSGERIASAGWINLKAPLENDPTYHIVAGDVEALLERTQDGKWKHFDLLPEPKEEKQETPVDLTIESAQIGFLDRTASQPKMVRLAGKDIKVNGSGKRWIAKCAIDIAGYGSVNGLVRIAPEVGIGFNLTASGLNAGSLMKAVEGSLEARKIAELKTYRADSAIFTGSLQGHISPKNAVAFDARGKIDSTSLNLGGRRIERLSFVGSANEKGLNGTVEGDLQGNQARFDGEVGWSDGIQVEGAVNARSLGTKTIPKWAVEYLPRELKLGQSQFSGWFSLDRKGEAGIDGTIRAEEAQWSDEKLKNVYANLHIDPRQVLLSNLKGQWMGSPTEGDICVNLAQSELTGALSVKYLDLKPASKRIGGPNLTGYANVKTMLSGKLGQPVIDIRTNATASTSIYGSPRLFLGNIEFAGSYSGGKLSIQRFAATGRNGVFVAKGLIDIDTTRMDLKLDGNGVKLAEFSPEIKGTGLFRLEITGTPSKPVATGRAEIIGADVMGYSIPFAGGTVRWDANGVMVRDLIAVKGATTAKGYVSWNSRDLQLDGEVSITDVILSDWLGDGVSGSLGVRRASLRGTIESPIISARGSGKNIVVSGVRVDDASFNVHVLRHSLIVNEVKLATGQGLADIAGYIDLSGSIGYLSGSARNLPLDRLFPAMPGSLSLTGSLSSDYSAIFNGTSLSSMQTEGSVKDVTVNGTLIGSGDLSAKDLGGLWSASLTIGQIERYIELSVPYYDQYENIARGSLTALNLDLATLHDAFKRYLPKNNPKLAEILDSAKGDVGLLANISSDQGKLNIDVSSATIENLSMNEQDLGKISLSASRNERIWNIRDLTWQKEDQKATLHGTVDEIGDMKLDGDIYNVRNQLLTSIVPEMPRLTGSVDLLSFSASGPTSNPTIQASLKASNIGLANDSVKAEDLITTDVNVNNLLVQDGSIEADGWMFYKGIRGEFKAKVPFRYPFEVPEQEQIEGSLTLATNQLEAFIKYVPSIASTTTGQITGGLTLSGTIAKPELNGDIKVEAPVVAVRDVDTSLKNVNAGIKLRSNEVTLSLAAQADKGGSIEASSSVKGLDLADLTANPSKFLSLPISGYASIKALDIHHNANKYGSIALVADGKINVSGTVRNPVISSDSIALKDVNGVAPTEFTQQPESDRPEINPQFNIKFDVLPGAKAKASNAEVVVYGSGTLAGTMYRPEVQSNFTLTKGSLKLPNARVQLHEGGSMRFGYRIDQEGLGQARMDVDLHGSTNVTAVRYGDTVDRYSIELQMRGNILETGKLQITAQSDPPDLSQDRIMNILGQGDFFQGLAQGNQSAIASFALPTFLDPVTSVLAKNFGLEYLMVEYDMQKRTTLTAARTLGGGFTLMGRRQISPSTFGEELYEIKLNYRLPFNNSTLRSFMLSLGADQDRPWKFSIEYGRRF